MYRHEKPSERQMFPATGSDQLSPVNYELLNTEEHWYRYLGFQTHYVILNAECHNNVFCQMNLESLVQYYLRNYCHKAHIL